jgi:hypothetical protein
MSYYARAQHAEDSAARIGLATQASAQGQHLAAIAKESHHDVDVELNAQDNVQQGQGEPIELLRRDGSPAEPAEPTDAPATTTPSSPATSIP